MTRRAESDEHALASPPKRRWLRRLAALVSLILAWPLGAAGFLAAFFATAVIADTPWILIAVGAVAGLTVVAGLTYLAMRVANVRRRVPIALGTGGAAAALFLAVFAVFVLQPLVPLQDQYVRDVPDDVMLWTLQTGSVVAVRIYPGQGARRDQPIVFLHGGPGGYSLALQQTVDVVSRLSEDGFDVYFYDQVGGGLSEPLSDVTQYTINRHLADLEAVYDKIGAKRVILIGSSWGATLGANYMARHPEHVAAAVFSGPGPIFYPDWIDVGDGGLEAQFTPEQKAAFADMIEKPRLLTAILLSEVNANAAARLASQNELGSFFDKVANAFYLPVAVCDPDRVKTITSGYGFWSNRLTGNSLRLRTDDPKSLLRKNATPVLVMRGECEYKKFAVAQDYVDVFPNAKFVAVEDAGHMLYWEKPDAFLEEVRRFLDANR